MANVPKCLERHQWKNVAISQVLGLVCETSFIDYFEQMHISNCMQGVLLAETPSQAVEAMALLKERLNFTWSFGDRFGEIL
jgi:hypothetical protein